MQRIPECTVQLSDGRFCEAESMEDAPFPICERHAHAIFMHMRDTSELTLENIRKALGIRRPEYKMANDAREAAYRAQSVVYYVRLNDRIKIGYTVNLKARLIGLRVSQDHVLATEPGGRKLEAIRHRQFAHLRYGRWEEFEPVDELMEHIAAIRVRYGAPDITSYITSALPPTSNTRADA